MAARPGTERESYEKHSPHRFAAEFQDADADHPQRSRFPRARSARAISCSRRCSDWACQSKMINFPDEGHWVLKPANSEFWHREVFAWLKDLLFRLDRSSGDFQRIGKSGPLPPTRSASSSAKRGRVASRFVLEVAVGLAFAAFVSGGVSSLDDQRSRGRRWKPVSRAVPASCDCRRNP